MKAMYIKAPGQVEFKDIEMPVRKKGEVSGFITLKKTTMPKKDMR